MRAETTPREASGVGLCSLLGLLVGVRASRFENVLAGQKARRLACVKLGARRARRARTTTAAAPNKTGARPLSGHSTSTHSEQHRHTVPRLKIYIYFVYTSATYIPCLIRHKSNDLLPNPTSHTPPHTSLASTQGLRHTNTASVTPPPPPPTTTNQ